VGNYRRNTTPHPSASFFDTSNKEGERMRKAAAEAAVNDMSQWFQTPGNLIAILDATNSTKSRRRWIKDRCDAEGIETLFVESKCDDEELIMANIKEVKLTSPDYAGLDPEDAAKDFRERIRMYDRVYETLDEDETDMTYCKIIDVGSKVIINRIQDYLQSRVVYYLMNLHIKPRSIWISRVSPPFHTAASVPGAHWQWSSGFVAPNEPLADALLPHPSTANPCTTSPAKSAATPTSPPEESNTPTSCPPWSRNPQATSPSPSGRRRSNARPKRPAISLTRSSPGKPWMNSTPGSATG